MILGVSSGTWSARRRPARPGGTLLAGAPIVLVTALMAGLADRLIYFPIAEHDGSPAAIGLAHEDVWPVAGDGVKLHGWFVPGGEDAPGVLFLHGNAGNVSHRLDKLAVLHRLGLSVLMLDYRGYGRSEGSPDEPGLHRDAVAGYEELARRVPADRAILLYGESLGGAVATELATRREIAGLVLESTPSSILAVAKHHYPVLPVQLFLAARFDALSRVDRVTAPILVLHSTEDEIVPFTMAEAILAKAPEPKRMVRLRGGHNDCFLVSSAAYEGALRDFLEQLRRERR
jgi:fermentation-respiration switch protein FrsA (DUF1100 family)